MIRAIAIILFFVFYSSTVFAQKSSLQVSIESGEKIYTKKCAVCHGKGGLGKGKRIPPLANSDYLMNNQEASIRGILFGQNEEIIVNGQPYNRKMKAVKLSNEEIANVMNYIQNSWGNKNISLVTESDVSKIRNPN
jgi:mono/diheme cytochrome c family protein